MRNPTFLFSVVSSVSFLHQCAWMVSLHASFMVFFKTLKHSCYCGSRRHLRGRIASQAKILSSSLCLFLSLSLCLFVSLSLWLLTVDRWLLTADCWPLTAQPPNPCSKKICLLREIRAVRSFFLILRCILCPYVREHDGFALRSPSFLL